MSKSKWELKVNKENEIVWKLKDSKLLIRAIKNLYVSSPYANWQVYVMKDGIDGDAEFMDDLRSYEPNQAGLKRKVISSIATLKHVITH